MTSSHIARLFGKRLRAERERLGLSREQLSEGAHLAPSFLAYLEHGQRTPSLETIVNLAKCLNVAPAALLADVYLSPITPDERLISQFTFLLRDRTWDQKKEILKALRALIKNFSK